MSQKILHVASAEKFLPDFINFIKDNFDFSEHMFFLTKGMAQQDIIKHDNISLLVSQSRYDKYNYYKNLLRNMYQADKIILHSLADMSIVKILYFNPWLLAKCHWVIWGNDLYTYKFGKRNRRWRVREIYRRAVIRRMGYLVTYLEGDVELARKWYGAKGKYIECIMYLSNTYKEVTIPNREDNNAINIQLGNSANPTNHHIEALKKLLPFKDMNIRIYTPLSYSDQTHAKKVIETGQNLFGDKFVPLTEFMPLKDYLQLQANIDVAVFNNSRQQALGNIITLLGLGKTVYLRSGTTQWQFFKNKSIEVYDIELLNELSIKPHQQNVEKIKQFFSTSTLLQQLNELFR